MKMTCWLAGWLAQLPLFRPLASCYVVTFIPLHPALFSPSCRAKMTMSSLGRPSLGRRDDMIRCCSLLAAMTLTTTHHTHRCSPSPCRRSTCPLLHRLMTMKTKMTSGRVRPATTGRGGRCCCCGGDGGACRTTSGCCPARAPDRALAPCCPSRCRRRRRRPRTTMTMTWTARRRSRRWPTARPCRRACGRRSRRRRRGSARASGRRGGGRRCGRSGRGRRRPRRCARGPGRRSRRGRDRRRPPRPTCHSPARRSPRPDICRH
jgi:hypothetical protein